MIIYKKVEALMIIERATENYFYPRNAYNVPLRLDVKKLEDTDRDQTAIDRQYFTMTLSSGVANGDFVFAPEDGKLNILHEQVVTATCAMAEFAKNDIVELLEFTQVDIINNQWIDTDADPNGEHPYDVLDNFIITLAKRREGGNSELVENAAVLVQLGVRNSVVAEEGDEPSLTFVIAVTKLVPQDNLQVGADLDRVNWQRLIAFAKCFFKKATRELQA